MTIQLFNSILTIATTLKTNEYKKNIFNNYIFKHNYNTNIFSNSIEYHNLNCWKSYCIFDYCINNLNDENIIYSLNFNINKKDINNSFIKIDYLYVNNDYYDIKYNEYFKRNNKLKEDETNLIIKSLMIYIENFAKKENINKIIMDVHINLERYNYELKDLGFILNYNINNINPYWIQCEKII